MHSHPINTRTPASVWRTALRAPGRPVALALLCGLSACGGHSEPTLAELTLSTASVNAAAGATTPQPSATRPAPPTAPAGARAAAHGVLLSGVPGMNACAAVSVHLDRDDAPASAHRLKAVIDRSATVGQVNAALDAVGARIVSMRPGSSEVLLELDTTRHAPSAQRVEQHLTASRAFYSVGSPDAVLAQPTSTAASVVAVAVAPDDSSTADAVDDHDSPP